jgi:hypothetical protein
VSSDDRAGSRRRREQLPLDVAAGQYGYDETYFARMVDPTLALTACFFRARWTRPRVYLVEQ